MRITWMQIFVGTKVQDVAFRLAASETVDHRFPLALTISRLAQSAKSSVVPGI